MLNSVQFIVKINRSEESRKELTLSMQMILSSNHLSLKQPSMCLVHRKQAVRFKQFLFEDQSVVHSFISFSPYARSHHMTKLQYMQGSSNLINCLNKKVKWSEMVHVYEYSAGLETSNKIGCSIMKFHSKPSKSWLSAE